MSNLIDERKIAGVHGLIASSYPVLLASSGFQRSGLPAEHHW